MEKFSQKQLGILSQLAQEYEQKYQQLDEICRSAQPETIGAQLKLRSELTTDRFRAAQQALLSMVVANDEAEDHETLQVVTALCRCFDEMRILFNMLLQHGAHREVEDAPINQA